jgi:predicted HicB family RNase H-like nuclease
VLDFSEYKKYFVFMTKKKSKMGRPPLKAKDRKTALVTLRIKPSQRKELEQDAKAKGLSLSSYLLECWQKERK